MTSGRIDNGSSNGIHNRNSRNPDEQNGPRQSPKDTSLNMNDFHINLIPQDPASPRTCKRHQERTIFTQKQHEEFSQNVFPDKILQKELALKLNYMTQQ